VISRREEVSDLKFDLGSIQDHSEINFEVSYGTPSFSLHILVAHLESFPKYNKIFFYEVFFEL